ncbi:hypothetical protein QR98_0078740 [Sarcoptes scabiei]|uniref:Uncharacterized protein n=1 Tax=Sarcoptes scabiei TaxID=52283 RepID=A0A132AFX2_SARSC|nr:hypothetical protein QR98_0078740 [Sarcoptes scabiei]
MELYMILDALTFIYPYPNEADLQWRQNPNLSLTETDSLPRTQPTKEIVKKKSKSRPNLPRNIRLERLYTGSPALFDDYETNYGRRPELDAYVTRSPARCIDDYVLRPANTSNAMILEQISFAEEEDDGVDVDEDPIEAYVEQQHKKMLASSQNRSSTPIQNQLLSGYQHQQQHHQTVKSHATIV